MLRPPVPYRVAPLALALALLAPLAAAHVGVPAGEPAFADGFGRATLGPDWSFLAAASVRGSAALEDGGLVLRASRGYAAVALERPVDEGHLRFTWDPGAPLVPAFREWKQLYVAFRHGMPQCYHPPVCDGVHRVVISLDDAYANVRFDSGLVGPHDPAAGVPIVVGEPVTVDVRHEGGLVTVHVDGRFAGAASYAAAERASRLALSAADDGGGQRVDDLSYWTETGLAPGEVPVGGPPLAAGRGLAGVELAPIPPRDVVAPGVNVPATCTLGPCSQPIRVAERELALGGSPGRDLDTPAVPVPETCAAGGLVCAGPFTLPPQRVATVPPTEPVVVRTPGLVVPAVCEAAAALCLPPTRIGGEKVAETPGVERTRLVPPVSVAVAVTGLEAVVEPGASGRLGPVEVVVPVPGVGDVPVTVCATPCPTSVGPGATVRGEVRVVVTVGDERHEASVPLATKV